MPDVTGNINFISKGATHLSATPPTSPSAWACWATSGSRCTGSNCKNRLTEDLSSDQHIDYVRQGVVKGFRQIDDLTETAVRLFESTLQPLEEKAPSPVSQLSTKAREQALAARPAPRYASASRSPRTRHRADLHDARRQPPPTRRRTSASVVASRSPLHPVAARSRLASPRRTGTSTGRNQRRVRQEGELGARQLEGLDRRPRTWPRRARNTRCRPPRTHPARGLVTGRRPRRRARR